MSHMSTESEGLSKRLTSAVVLMFALLAIGLLAWWLLAPKGPSLAETTSDPTLRYGGRTLGEAIPRRELREGINALSGRSFVAVQGENRLFVDRRGGAWMFRFTPGQPLIDRAQRQLLSRRDALLNDRRLVARLEVTPEQLEQLRALGPTPQSVEAELASTLSTHFDAIDQAGAGSDAAREHEAAVMQIVVDLASRDWTKLREEAVRIASAVATILTEAQRAEAFRNADRNTERNAPAPQTAAPERPTP